MSKSAQFGFENEFSLTIKLNDIEIQDIPPPLPEHRNTSRNKRNYKKNQ